MEGCYEKAILATDAEINGETKAVFSLLRSRPARSTFVAGERAWLRYRRASCSTVASHYEGGTLAPVIAAACVVGRNRAHLRDLTAMRKTLSFR